MKIQPIYTDKGIQTFPGERVSRGTGKGGRNTKPSERVVVTVSPKHTLALVNGYVQVVRRDKIKAAK